ncbi:uncharacterized protein BDR25DRAFT_343878, partial [Lindgomyces ingoldianus]
MPNIIRRPRSRPPERQSNRTSDPGTHLTYEERCQIYTLSQSLGWSQRAIALSLKLPRSTVQSAIYAMTKTSRRRQDHKPILTTPVYGSALPVMTSSGAIYESTASYITAPIQPDIRQPSSHHSPSAAATAPSYPTPIPEDHHRHPPQPAVAASSLDNTNDMHDGPAGFSSEHCDLHHQTREHKDSSFQPSLPQNPPKLMPIEPRVENESSAYCTFPLRT